MRNQPFSLLVILFLIASPASSEEADCFDTAVTTLAMHQCYQEKMEDAAKKFNDTYQNLIGLAKNHGDEWAEDLQKAQNKWVEFRDLNCTFYANYLKGGTGAGLESAGCRLRMTEEREKELNEYATMLLRRGYKPVD